MDEEMKKLNTEKIHGQEFMGSAYSSHNSIITIECITHFSGALFHTYKVSKKKKWKIPNDIMCKGWHWEPI